MDNAEATRQHELCTCGHSLLVHLARCCISGCKCNRFKKAEVARPSGTLDPYAEITATTPKIAREAS